jgi:hypothetical protein
MGDCAVRVCVLRRVLLALALALPFGGCSRDPYVYSSKVVTAGDWRIERQYDRVANAPISSALTTAMASNSAVAFPQRASLQLLCFVDKPVANFRFEFKVGTNYNSFIGYRFDDKPGHEIGGQFMTNAMSVAIEEPAEVAQFASELANSKMLYIRIRSFNAGRTTAEFKVDGAPEAIASAFAACPLKPAAAPAPQAAQQSRRERVSAR